MGQRVKAGDKCWRNWTPQDLKLGQEAAKAAASRAARRNYELAAAEFKRYKDLRDQGFISGLELERREATLKAQKAQLEQAQAQARVQGNQAGYAALVATAAGVITGHRSRSRRGAGRRRTGAAPGARRPARRAVFAVPEDGGASMRAKIGRAGA